MPKLSLAKLERHLYAAADILRREGMDAVTYKDFIFGLLFLKRCSDVFDAEREKIVGRKVEQGMEAKTRVASPTQVRPYDQPAYRPRPRAGIPFHRGGSAMKTSTILDHIDSGQIAPPEVQRGIILKGEQVCELFDSVQRWHDWKRIAP
jgi:hypothetical protein